MRIAIVDDHAMVRSGIASVLQASMADLELIVEAGTSQELLNKTSSHDEFDLILLDYHLPGTSSKDNFALLAKRFARAKILFLSSDEDPKIISETIRQGASGYLVKSSNIDILIPTIKYVLEGGTYIPTTLLNNRPESTAILLSLTKRQKQVFEQLLAGHSNKAIASQLNISENTVKTHLMATYKILGIDNRAEAISRFGGN